MSLGTATRFWLAGGALLVGLVAGLLLLRRDAPFVPQRTVLLRYVFTVRNTTNRALPDASLSFFLPRATGAAQRSDTIESSEQFTIQEEPHGNRSLVVSTGLPPFGQKVISIDARVALAASPQPEPLPEGSFVHPEQHIESDDDAIATLANSIVGPPPLDTARQAFELVRKILTSSGYVKEDRGAKWALRAGSGDCTEFAYLVVALLRARGIPARVLSGFVVERDTLLRPIQYHNWAEFYDGERWRIADPHGGLFDEGYDRYVSFRVISAANGSRIVGAQRFGASDPEVEIEMGP